MSHVAWRPLCSFSLGYYGQWQRVRSTNKAAHIWPTSQSTISPRATVVLPIAYGLRRQLLKRKPIWNTWPNNGRLCARQGFDSAQSIPIATFCYLTDADVNANPAKIWPPLWGTFHFESRNLIIKIERYLIDRKKANTIGKQSLYITMIPTSNVVVGFEFIARFRYAS